MTKLDLPRRYRDQIEALLHTHMPDVEVWAYGSRVSGENHEGSDLDLVLRSPDLKRIPHSQLSALTEALEASNVPILVQTHDWARLPKSYHREIEREYVVLVEKVEDGGESGWREMPFSEAVLINPLVRLDRGVVYPFVDMAAVNAGSRSVYSSEQREFKGGGSRFQNGDTLMARITPCLENGKIARYHSQGTQSEAYGSTEFIVIRGCPKVTDNNFAYYLTRWEKVRNYAIGQMTGTSGRQRVPIKSLDHLTISVPSFPEQRAIAHILGTLDDKIELNRRMNETLEEMARALFKSWFVDFDPVRAKMEGCDPGLPPDVADLFPDRLVDSELGPIPEGWEVQTLGDLIELAYGKALKADDRKGGSIPVYGSNGQVGWHDKKLVAGPGIVVGRKGNPGIVKWTHSDFFPIDTTFYVVSRNTNEELPFLFFALTAQDLPSIAADSAVPGLNRNLAYMNRQLVPNKLVVERFNHYASTIFTRHHHIEEESRTLAALRDALLPKLISGELSIR